MTDLENLEQIADMRRIDRRQAEPPTACAKGHPYTESSLRQRMCHGRIRRFCRVCDRQRSQRRAKFQAVQT